MTGHRIRTSVTVDGFRRVLLLRAGAPYDAPASSETETSTLTG